MNVYDFDNTIYDGESAVDFFFFCLKKDVTLLRLVPLLLIKLVKYKMCLITIEELREYVEKYAKDLLDDFENFDDIITEFWQKNLQKIKPFYLEQKREDDILLTATFGFLIEIPVRELGIKTVISSEIDTKTGKLIRLCYREHKPELLQKYISGNEKICFYTDSMNDKSMIDLADEAYLVKGKKIKRLK